MPSCAKSFRCFATSRRKAVIEARDVKHTIYEMPLMLHEEGLDDLVCELLHIKTPPPDLTNWRKFVERVVSPKEAGQDRGRRQIHRFAGRVQEHLRIAHARGREPGLRNRSEADRCGIARWTVSMGSSKMSPAF